MVFRIFKKRILRMMSLIVMVMLIFSLVGCSEENEADNDTVTFSLDKVSNTSFTITVHGARWRAGVNFDFWVPYIIDYYYLQVTKIDGNSIWITSSFYYLFNIIRTSPTVLTFSLDTNYYTNISGTVSLSSENYLSTYGAVMTDGDDGKTYKANSSKSSIAF